MNGMEQRRRPDIAASDEDPNVVVAGSSPPCFMHELDPVWLGYLPAEEVRALLTALLAARWPGTVLEAAWLHAMLQRHLASLDAPRPRGPWRTDDGAQAASAARSGDLVCRLRGALPRIWDEALRRDLAEVLRMMERDRQQRQARPGA
ncbi:hypothetical protein JYK14_25540 [Siccirubricoccus sp. KC 17139]|uniref:Uncharacterized protein n=1 Tax=Siccirubricoccus soli TaxID=2899147 RepID=A0ABT1DC41_9PROT|nr:hypothetical protein [Siccirubricoccus soli]MCO6419502.1 hypothetical protein [Siccirubricoccus soli]MCP2685637.1 hypothetical protein [Siccirubricoccus soli]